MEHALAQLVCLNCLITKSYLLCVPGAHVFCNIQSLTSVRLIMSVTKPKVTDVFTSETIVFSDDGGWCWFESPGALQYGSLLLIGSVASGGHDKNRCGNVELHLHDCFTQMTETIVLHDQFELDDHDGPALLIRPDGRLLVLYAKHGTEPHNYSRLSLPDTKSFNQFGPVQLYTPSTPTELTYANLILLPNEANRIYDFFRGLHGSFKPSYLYSDDLGTSWHNGNVYINVPSTIKHRPYVRYTSNERDTIHMIYTEGHPRDYDNSLYHIYYRSGDLYQSDGIKLSSLQVGLDSPDQGTKVYQGDSQHVAWIVDLVLDRNEYPVCVYSVQYNSAGLPVGQGGDDIRYRYARWNGSIWQNFSLAYAGCRLYSGEDDYTGLAVIEPDDPTVVYISTNSDPATGEPLISRKDQQRHYELFYGKTDDGGQTWSWITLTSDSTADNLRPMRPKCANKSDPNPYRALVWLRGKYLAYTDYLQEVVGRIWTMNPSEDIHENQ
ncbi:unnamed protein product [Adineta ricciae]|uniref:BNR repeat-containing family member n=1 Tax=Adineta ricciae TaxID=249248 RepID=A0A814PSY2_ADIRI|nr:unnamed protein product [Adineta ricciae]